MLSVILFMNGARMGQRNWVVLGRLEKLKGYARRLKEMFFSYCENAPLIQLT